MDTMTHTQEIDLALVRRDAARNYIRKRDGLRMMVRMGLCSREEARARRAEVVEHFTTWRAARALLRGA